MSKFNYLLRSVTNFSKKASCPHCNNGETELVEKKYFVTKLVRCSRCKLQYRLPKDDQEFLKEFYQTDYKVDVEMMTGLPSEKELNILKGKSFEKLRNYYPIISNFTTTQENKIIDYGCSWGYNLYKSNKKGLDCQGFELLEPRAKFGKEKLGVDLAYNEEGMRIRNDVFYSSHVIEHLADIQAFVNEMKFVLRVYGTSITLCANCSSEFRKRKPVLFSYTWGQLHPYYNDVDFIQNIYQNNPYIITTGDDVCDLGKIMAWDGTSHIMYKDRSGYELLVIAKPNIINE